MKISEGEGIIVQQLPLRVDKSFQQRIAEAINRAPIRKAMGQDDSSQKF